MFDAAGNDLIYRKTVILQQEKRRNAGVRSLSKQEEEILCIKGEISSAQVHKQIMGKDTGKWVHVGKDKWEDLCRMDGSSCFYFFQ